MPNNDRHAGLPASWSDSAKETYAQIEAENPELDSASLSTLYEACSLFALADALAAQVDRDGFTVDGSTGQTAAHPLLSEIRLNRVQAMSALRGLGITKGQSRSSAAASVLASKRWNGPARSTR